MKFNNVFVVDDDKIFHFIIKKLLLNSNINVSPSFFENGGRRQTALQERASATHRRRQRALWG